MGESDEPKVRICDGCGKPAVIVFRCYGCNAVASEPLKEMA
jgi:hypothetical protein